MSVNHSGGQKYAKYRIKISAVRQETLIVKARSEDAAISALSDELAQCVSDESDTLEHFVICSVELDQGG